MLHDVSRDLVVAILDAARTTLDASIVVLDDATSVLREIGTIREEMAARQVTPRGQEVNDETTL